MSDKQLREAVLEETLLSAARQAQKLGMSVHTFEAWAGEAWTDAAYDLPTWDRQPCPHCGTLADEDGYCTDVGCTHCGKAVIR